MKVCIKKSLAKGSLLAPPSKSYAHRLIISAFIQNKYCVINNVKMNNDIFATLDCISALGGSFELTNDKVIFHGNNKHIEASEIRLNCNESGSTLRFMIPVALMMYPNIDIVMEGTEKLLSRGLTIYEDLFKEENIKYEHSLKTFKFNGSLNKTNFKILGNISSQFITGLIFALTLSNKDSVIEIIEPIESKSYIDITLDVLKMFNVNVSMIDNIINIKHGSIYNNSQVTVEADYSNAAFLEALNIINEENKVNVLGLNPNSCQGDKKYIEYFRLLKEGFNTLDIKDCVDLGPILFTLATYLNGAKIINTKRLRIKESDRVSSIVTELEKFGADINIYDNEVIINKAPLHKPSIDLEGYNDHRIVMSLSILLTQFGGSINGCGAVSKSYPTFFDDLLKVGIDYEFK